jgi:hypothetical protein
MACSGTAISASVRASAVEPITFQPANVATIATTSAGVSTAPRW